MRTLAVCGIVAGALSASAVPALAQDQCHDILKDGPFQTAEYRENDYFRQIIWARFARSTYESSKSDKSGGFGVPIGEIVLGANYSQSDYDQKKAQIQAERFSDVTATREVSVALMKGDDLIVDAWEKCMANSGGGQSVRFEVMSSTSVVVIAEYRLQGGNNENRLLSDVKFPDGVIVDDSTGCLKKDAVIRAGNPCRAVITFQNPRNDITVLVPGESSSAAAYLPMRLKLTTERKPYEFSSEQKLARSAAKVSVPMTARAELSESQIKDGWMFDPASARLDIDVIYLKRASCNKTLMNPEYYTFSYGYLFHAPDRQRGGRDGRANCAARPYIMMKRSIWVNADL